MKTISTPARPLSLLAAACLTLVGTLSAQDRPQQPNDTPQRPPRGDFQPGQQPPRDGQQGQQQRFQQRGDGQPGNNFRPGGQPQDGQRGNFPNPMAGLTEEQQQAVRDVMQQMREDMRDFGDRMMTARRELNDVMFAGKIDEKLIRDRYMTVAKLEADATVMRARAFGKLRERVGPEVSERLKMMFAGGMGMGGGMMGQGQRPGGFQDQPGQPPQGRDFRGSGRDGNQPQPQGGDRFNQRRNPQDNPQQPGDAPRRPTPPNP
ncbi:MAG: periplasmic heavy metal sensor [Verrucomicrobia bacterium]|nr:periplasmic heavy metal sensor [Verrucomicrobiota bacterium]